MNTVEKVLSGLGVIGILIVVVSLFGGFKHQTIGEIGGVPFYQAETPTSVSCTTSTSTQIVGTESSRQYIRITNIGTGTVFLGLGKTAVASSGIAIPTTMNWTSDNNFLYGGTINCIATGATSTTSVQDVI